MYIPPPSHYFLSFGFSDATAADKFNYNYEYYERKKRTRTQREIYFTVGGDTPSVHNKTSKRAAAELFALSFYRPHRVYHQTYLDKCPN